MIYKVKTILKYKGQTFKKGQIVKIEDTEEARKLYEQDKIKPVKKFTKDIKNKFTKWVA